MAGILFYLAPIDNASGKIFGLKQKFIAVRRNWGKRQRGCSVTGERSTPFSQGELAAQDRFGAIGKATALRMKDPSKLMQDQAAFKEQSEYATLRQYVWHQCANEYDAAQG